MAMMGANQNGRSWQDWAESRRSAFRLMKLRADVAGALKQMAKGGRNRSGWIPNGATLHGLRSHSWPWPIDTLSHESPSNQQQ
jgi:hypothetical protein